MTAGQPKWGSKAAGALQEPFKSQKTKTTQYDFTPLWNLKQKTTKKEQSELKLIDSKNRFVVTRRKEGWRRADLNGQRESGGW